MSVDLEQRPPRVGERPPALRAGDAREAHPERLEAQFDVIIAELRRRVGGTFTLRELSGPTRSGRLGLQAVEEQAPVPGWARTVSMVGDAAFHAYARGAVDYSP